MNFKEQWNLEMALQVLGSESVDSEIWAEAAKWLILFGPADIKKVLLEASTCATSNFYPHLKPVGFNEKGEPCFDVAHLAEVLGVDPEDLSRSLAELEGESGNRIGHVEEDIFKIQ